MSGSGRPLPLNFSSRTASTGILADDNTYIEKGEFELTLKAEVGPADELNTSLTEGFWACICTAKIGGEIQSRDILLPSSSWDKPDKFKTNLRRAFVGANMWIDFSPKQLSAYYKYLKEQYRSRRERKLYLVEVLGRQPESDYWVFSREIHCEQFQVLDVEEQRYFLPRNSPLVQYSSSMENVDVSFDYIGELRALIPLMAEAFSHNFYPVVRLLAYAVSSFYKKDVEEIFEGLSTMIVYCKDKNIGKTAALKFLSRLLGFGRKKHPSMITGASGPGSGTPSSEILNKLKLSTFPVLCDDTNLPSGMKSLLVSLKDGFSQSTKEDGNRTPEGQLILTSNKLPTLDERASSRILLNSFRKKGLQVSRKQQKALEDLKVKAWSLDQMILFFVYLGSGLEDQKETINDIKEIVKFMLPEIMERTAVDLSIQLFYSSKLLAVSGFGSFAQALRMFVDTQYNDVKKFHAAEIDFIPEASDAIHSLVALLEKELEDIEEQAVWILQIKRGQ